MTRYARIGVPIVLALTLLGSTGCMQVVKLVTIDLGNLSAQNGAASAGKFIDLAAENSTYRDHRDDFSYVHDVAILGTFKNNLASPVNAEVYLVPQPAGQALLPDKAAVIAAGGVLIWDTGLAGNETLNLQWDHSARQLKNRGTIQSELEGDATFTIYVFGSTGTYDITATNASFAVMIGADLFGAP